jgi:hypothetical protein
VAFLGFLTRGETKKRIVKMITTGNNFMQGLQTTEMIRIINCFLPLTPAQRSQTEIVRRQITWNSIDKIQLVFLQFQQAMLTRFAGNAIYHVMLIKLLRPDIRGLGHTVLLTIHEDVLYIVDVQKKRTIPVFTSDAALTDEGYDYIACFKGVIVISTQIPNGRTAPASYDIRFDPEMATSCRALESATQEAGKKRQTKIKRRRHRRGTKKHKKRRKIQKGGSRLEIVGDFGREMDCDEVDRLLLEDAPGLTRKISTGVSDDGAREPLTSITVY